MNVCPFWAGKGNTLHRISNKFFLIFLKKVFYPYFCPRHPTFSPLFTINRASTNATMTFNQRSTDDALLQGCREGNRLAQKYLYQRYFGKLFGIAMRYTNGREEAQEVMNLSFLKIFESIHQFREIGSFAGWMARIVLHTAIDHARSKSSYRRVMDFNTQADTPISSDAISQLATEEIMTLIQQLPAATRTVFCLYVIEGYKHHEIANTLGIDEGTSKWHLSNARRLLQPRILKQQEIKQ